MTDNNHHIVCILDTETANFVDAPIPYDIGYVLYDATDRKIIARHSFVVHETFTDKDLMNSAYYAKKVPQYWEDIKSGKRQMKRITTIKNFIAKEFKEYSVTMVGAYNMGFDKRATNNGIRYNTYSKYRWFFPYGIEFFDIWHGACSSFLRSKHFIKWAIKNGFVSDKGNIQTSAEVAYKYITKNLDFVESHTGLEDVEIETAIFEKIYQSKMRFDFSVIACPWRIVQNYRKQFNL